MAWLHIKRPEKDEIHYVSEEAFKATFEPQGYVVVEDSNVQPPIPTVASEIKEEVVKGDKRRSKGRS